MSVKSLLNEIRKTTGSMSFAESKYGEINGYIDTGCYALNRLVSGDIYKGIPNGRVIVLAGESQTGKSFISAQIAANALNKHKYDNIFYFDSEGGGLKTFFENQGCDVSKLEHILVDSIEDATVKILAVYDAIAEEKKENPEYKALCILDSLGAMTSNKFISDAIDKSKLVSDMGGFAKLVNSLCKGTIIRALKTNVSIIFINHIYDNPADMFPSKIKIQSGGKRVQYLSSITIQCSRVLEKKENKDEEAAYKGTTLKFFTTKNRIVKPFIEAEMYVDFSKGISKWDGLIEAAMRYDLIKQSGAWYEVPKYTDKKLRKDEILTNDELWATILEDFNKASIKDMQYSNMSEIEKLNNIIEKPIINDVKIDE